MHTSTNLRCGSYPGGSYTQTCRDIDYDQSNGMLTAACRQRNGAYNWTDLYAPDWGSGFDDIVNCDGELAANSCW